MLRLPDFGPVIGHGLDLSLKRVSTWIKELTLNISREMTIIDCIDGKIFQEQLLSIEEIENLPEIIDQEILPVGTLHGDPAAFFRLHGMKIGHEIENSKSGMDEKRLLSLPEDLDSQVRRMIEDAIGFHSVFYNTLFNKRRVMPLEMPGGES
jgi:hypothetical protein